MNKRPMSLAGPLEGCRGEGRMPLWFGVSTLGPCLFPRLGWALGKRNRVLGPDIYSSALGPGI